VQASPLADKPQRSRRQLAVDDLQRSELDLRDVLAVLSVKVRRG
jgi:hypothetical protein